MAASWYQRHLGGSTPVLLITNDRENKRKATEEGISAETGIFVLFFPFSLILEKFNLSLNLFCCFLWVLSC